MCYFYNRKITSWLTWSWKLRTWRTRPWTWRNRSPCSRSPTSRELSTSPGRPRTGQRRPGSRLRPFSQTVGTSRTRSFNEPGLRGKSNSKGRDSKIPGVFLSCSVGFLPKNSLQMCLVPKVKFSLNALAIAYVPTSYLHMTQAELKLYCIPWNTTPDFPGRGMKRIWTR